MYPGRTSQPPNKGMHQTKGARSGRFAADRLEAPFAGDARCYPGPVVAAAMKAVL